MSDHPGTVLVVDDEPENLNVLESMLAQHHYTVTLFPNAELALRAARGIRPDIFLLDVRMPQMDGYELCRSLKQDVELADIPVIFVSALDTREDVLKGFTAGGIDYVTKPFCTEEVVARVRTHIALRRTRSDLARSHREVADHYEKLREAESLRDSLVHMLGHDMRSLLHSIIGHIELVAESAGPAMEEADTRSLGLAVEATRALNRMVTQMIDVSRWEAGRMPLSPSHAAALDLVRGAVDAMSGILHGRRVEVEAHPRSIRVRADAELTRRVLHNLIENAVKYGPEDTPIHVGAAAQDDSVRFSVTDHGPGVPPEHLGQIFDKFTQAGKIRRRYSASSGLGLTFCRMAVEAQGGQIGVQSQPAGGCTFWFTLPQAASDAAAQGAHAGGGAGASIT